MSSVDMSHEYLSIRRNKTLSNARKTEIYEVYSKRSGQCLGEIKWFGRWRQYALFPSDGTIWNPDCLCHIADVCWQLTREHREASAA